MSFTVIDKEAETTTVISASVLSITGDRVMVTDLVGPDSPTTRTLRGTVRIVIAEHDDSDDSSVTGTFASAGVRGGVR